MNVLVVGGSGLVGSHVVQSLLARDVRVTVLTRGEARGYQLPKGVRSVAGDLLDPTTIRTVFSGMDALFLLNAVSATETHQGLMAVNGAVHAGVERIVYMSVHNLVRAVHLPHFGSKLPIEAAIKASCIPHTILRPNNFFQNDIMFRDALLLGGVYPQPIGDVGLSRVDVRDIADAAAAALTQSGHEGETYNLVGPDVLTGQRTAEIWSYALDKPIEYGGNDLDSWEQQMLQFLPSWMVFDFRLMYAFYQEHGSIASAGDVERLTRLLKRAPRRFEDFAEETARQWRDQR